MTTHDMGMTFLIWYVVTMGSGLWLSHRDKVKGNPYAGDAFYLITGGAIGIVAAFIFRHGDTLWTTLFGV